MSKQTNKALKRDIRQRMEEKGENYTTAKRQLEAFLSGAEVPEARGAGSAVFCPVCEAQFGGMSRCPWHECRLLPVKGADPTALAFYTALAEIEARDGVDEPAETRVLSTDHEVAKAALDVIAELDEDDDDNDAAVLSYRNESHESWWEGSVAEFMDDEAAEFGYNEYQAWAAVTEIALLGEALPHYTAESLTGEPEAVAAQMQVWWDALDVRRRLALKGQTATPQSLRERREKYAANRARLWDQLQAAGGRGIELADQIDHLDRLLEILEKLGE